MTESEESNPSLTDRTVRSGGWSLLTQVGVRLIGLTQTLILARWLAPEMFGLFGLTMLTLSLLEQITAPGLFEALIQREETRRHLDTAWTANVIRGILIAALILLVAPLAAGFFDEPRLRYLLSAGALIPLFSGFRNIAVVYFQKDLSFHKEFAFKVIPPLFTLPIVVSTAYVVPSVWVLILMVFLESSLACLLSYVLHSYRPRFHFEMEEFRELFSFGRWILGNKIMKYILLEGDDVFVGKYLGSFQLGIYQLAYRLSQLPVKEISSSLSRVLFPAFSKLKDDVPRLRRAWLDSLRIVGLLAIPMSTGIYVLAPVAIEIVLGEKWMAMVGPVRVLAILGVLRSINYGAVFKATDNPQKITYLTAIRLVAMVVLIVPLTGYFGLIGTALTVMLSTLIIEPLALMAVLDILDARLRDFLNCFGLPVFSSAIMALAVVGFRRAIGVTGPVTLILSILSGASVYFVVLLGSGTIIGSPTNSLLGRTLTSLLRKTELTRTPAE